MNSFDIEKYPQGLQQLLTTSDLCELAAGAPDRSRAEALRNFDVAAAFAPHAVVDKTMARACRSGLWLLHNFLDESHSISQSIDNATGSFWHGIMHRREGDYSNAKYWFRRVGQHPVYEPLGRAANQLAPDAFPGSEWDPFAFVDTCQAAVRGQDSQASALCRLARREWELLFEYCYRRAIGNDSTT